MLGLPRVKCWSDNQSNSFLRGAGQRAIRKIAGDKRGRHQKKKQPTDGVTPLHKARLALGRFLPTPLLIDSLCKLVKTMRFSPMNADIKEKCPSSELHPGILATPPKPVQSPSSLRSSPSVFWYRGTSACTLVPVFGSGNIRMYPRSRFWYRGTSAKTTLWKPPFANPWPTPRASTRYLYVVKTPLNYTLQPWSHMISKDFCASKPDFLGDKSGESLGGSPPGLWRVPGLPGSLPQKFFGDFPGSSLTAWEVKT